MNKKTFKSSDGRVWWANTRFHYQCDDIMFCVFADDQNLAMVTHKQDDGTWGPSAWVTGLASYMAEVINGLGLDPYGHCSPKPRLPDFPRLFEPVQTPKTRHIRLVD